MDRARLLKHFDTLAATPGAVQRLRRFVLELGFSGRLTGDNQSGWKTVRLREVASMRLGKMLDAKKNKGRLYPYLRNTNVQWLRFDLSDVKDMRVEDSELAELSLLRGDLLICEGGEPGRCAIWNGEQSPMLFQKALHRVRPHANLNTAFLQYRLLSDAWENRLEQYITGATIKHFTGQELARYSLPLPPLAEQKRIVARVEELLALCDELEARQTAAREQRTRLVQSAFDHLTAAATPADFRRHAAFALQEFPHLTATPDSIPALRQAILSLAVQGRLVESSGCKSLDEKATFEPPIPCPSHWEWKQFGDLLESGPTNGFSPKPVSYPTKTKVLALSATTSGVFRSECFKYADLDVEEDSSLWLQDGDILIQRGNSLDYVGIAAVYDGTPRTFIYPDLMMKVRTEKSVNTAFAHLVLNSPFGREYFKSHASGTSGSMPKVNQATVRGFPFPLPPLAEQQRIVAKVASLMSWCDELEARLAAAQHAAAALLDSSLHALLATAD